MKRVAIVGSPGAGKTTFACKLHQKTNLPLIHLDYYYHQKKYDYYNDKDAWITRAKKLTQQPEWIIDGNYSRTMDQSFKNADTIIFLDYSRALTMSRVLKRWIKKDGHKDIPEDLKGSLKEDIFSMIRTF